MESAWNTVWWVVFLIGAAFFFGIAVWVAVTGVADVRDLLQRKNDE